jgi:hypothetical protein
MRTITMIATSVVATALAGCGGDNPTAGNSVVLTENSVATTPAPPEMPNAAEALPVETPTPAVTPTTKPATENSSVADGRIPVALQGRWGLVPADCTSTRGDNKGLLTITADALRFYESRGKPAEVIERDASRLVADFAMTGEGQEWTRRMVLDAQDGGDTLVRREQGADAMPGALRYRRCA